MYQVYSRRSPHSTDRSGPRTSISSRSSRMYCWSFFQLSSRRASTCCMKASRSVCAEAAGIDRTTRTAAASSFMLELDPITRRKVRDPTSIRARSAAPCSRRAPTPRRPRGWRDTLPRRPHPVLPVAIERRDRALPGPERVRTLAEARSAPRFADLPADRSEHLGDRFSAKSWIGPLDLPADAPGTRKDQRARAPLRDRRAGARRESRARPSADRRSCRSCTTRSSPCRT